jgi:hypothetical protein
MKFGRPHKLTVYKVPDVTAGDPFDLAEFEDYEIEHPSECKLVRDEILDCERYECSLAWNIDQVGLRWSLKYSGTPIKATGEYMIQSWVNTIRGFDFTETDGGISLVTKREWPRCWADEFNSCSCSTIPS